MMLKTILTLTAVNAVGMAVVIYFDKKKKRLASTSLIVTAWVACTVLDVLIVLITV